MHELIEFDVEIETTGCTGFDGPMTNTFCCIRDEHAESCEEVAAHDAETVTLLAYTETNEPIVNASATY